MIIMNEELIYQVLETVGEIPKGCVATYKQIACLIGREKNSRLVGKILAKPHIMDIILVIVSLIFKEDLFLAGLNKKNY